MIRLAQANNASPRKLYKLSSLIAGVDPKSLLMIIEKADISKLCELTNLDEDCLLKLTFFYQMGMYGDEDEQILRHISSFGMCTTAYCQVCPVCLHEQPYHRKLWEIRSVTTCPFHQCKLTTTCSKCQKNISPIRRFVTHCNCGFDLRKYDIEKVPESETLLAIMMNERLFGRESSRYFLTGELQELSFRHFLYLHILFCFYFYQILSSQVKVNYSAAFKPIHMHETSIKTFQMFVDWSRSFYDFIDSYRKIPKTFENSKLLKEFGMLHHQLIKHLDAKEYSFVLKSLLDYCNENKTQAAFLNKLKQKIDHTLSRTEKKIDITQAKDKYVDFKTTEKILGISEYIIVDLMRMREIIVVKGRKGIRYCAIESIEKIEKCFKKNIPMKSLNINSEELVTFHEIQTVMNRKIRISEFIVAIIRKKSSQVGL